MKLYAISDCHGYLPEIPSCDLLVIAGDTSPIVDHSAVFQRSWFESNFAEWANNINARGIILIGGNHDFIFEADDNFGNRLNALIPKLIYLQDSMMEVYWKVDKHINVWGSPWSLNFGPWAFMGSEKQLRDRYDLIPDDVDIIVSHTPPYHMLDRALSDGRSKGSKQLGRIIREKQPKLVICGHIHEGYGQGSFDNTHVINCSLMDVNYEPINPPIMVDF